ncbi:hypothetical protein [Nostoc sp. JL23]|uniref:hypothetical protein n=1 Tax=Nostoc sp. JL23 TaxID=2815394 RepID=UPI001DB83181|nr:hypothetical protein [Nostoc sp. JL23]MBN3875211.1 hypothetical protein [Nostoc sp. JL23]
MNLENPQQSCQEWQQILGLMDWDVSVKIVSADYLDEAEGQITWDLGKKIADIKLVKPEGYPFDAMRPYDMEQTLVHELLHLHFAPFNADTGLKAISQEQAINAIARALVNLKNANLQTQGTTPNS